MQWWPSLKVHHWATILRFLTTIGFLQSCHQSTDNLRYFLFWWICHWYLIWVTRCQFHIEFLFVFQQSRNVLLFTDILKSHKTAAISEKIQFYKLWTVRVDNNEKESHWRSYDKVLINCTRNPSRDKNTQLKIRRKSVPILFCFLISKTKVRKEFSPPSFPEVRNCALPFCKIDFLPFLFVTSSSSQQLWNLFMFRCHLIWPCRSVKSTARWKSSGEFHSNVTFGKTLTAPHKKYGIFCTYVLWFHQKLSFGIVSKGSFQILFSAKKRGGLPHSGKMRKMLFESFPINRTQLRGLGQIYHFGGFPTWFFQEQSMLLPKWISNPGICSFSP